MRPVQAVIAGEHEGRGAGEGEEIKALRPKELQAQDQGCDGAVGHTTEDRDQTDPRPKGRAQPQEAADHIAEDRAGKKRGDDFTAFKSGAQRDGGQ